MTKKVSDPDRVAEEWIARETGVKMTVFGPSSIPAVAIVLLVIIGGIAFGFCGK